MRVAILPELGDLVVAELTAARLRQWMDRLAQSPRQTRPIKGKPKYLAKPDNADTQRARRASANRVLAFLKAVLNLAHAAGHVENAGVGQGPEALSQHQGAAACASFPPTRRRASSTPPMRISNRCCGRRWKLECATGKYPGLASTVSAHFGTIAIHQSKTGKPRHIVLTPEAVEFFRVHCAGKSSDELMFLKANGQGWGKSDQARSMRRACLNVNVKPAGIPHMPAHLCIIGDHERHAVDGGGADARPHQSRDGLGSLWPPRTILRPRRDHQRRASVRRHDRPEDRPAAVTAGSAR